MPKYSYENIVYKRNVLYWLKFLRINVDVIPVTSFLQYTFHKRTLRNMCNEEREKVKNFTLFTVPFSKKKKNAKEVASI